MVIDTSTWWLFLCTVSLLNVMAWGASAGWLWRSRTRCHADTWALVRLQMILSAAYVLGCGYRSAFPVYDVQRLCMVDSWLSSVMVGRTVATIAEVCFAAQWALLLRDLARVTGNTTAANSARVIVPLIAVAEMCSWYAVLTTSNLGHVVEESIWAFCAALLVVNLALLRRYCKPGVQRVVAVVCVLGAAYVAYMVWVDVPMYWARWVQDMDHGRHYLTVAQGVSDTSGRWIVSHRWEDWKTEVVWMSLYFSVGVWLSVALMHLPTRASLRGTGAAAPEPRQDQLAGKGALMMKSTTAFSLVRVVRAVQFSEQGIRSAWRDEAAFRQELMCMLLLAPLTLWLQLPRFDTVLLLALMALVLVAELLNSGLEAVVDMTSPEFNVLAAKAKDCGSAAVFVALLVLGGAWSTLAGPALWARMAL